MWGEENASGEERQSRAEWLSDGFSRAQGRTAVLLLRLSAVSLFSISVISARYLLLHSVSFGFILVCVVF